jgi:chemotaxis protein MotA
MARKGSDTSTILGMAIGFGGLIVGFLLEGGKVLSLVGVSALIIIIAGTMGACVISFSLKDVLGIPRLIAKSMRAVRGPNPRLVQTLLEFAEKARKDGILSLEDTLEELEDETLKKGLRLVVDGTESETLIEVLENDLAVYEARMRDEAGLFEAAGGFSPTMGIIGTVMGLVLVLSRLGADTKELGHAIATAFIATLYGIAFANLIWLPVANKLKLQLKFERMEKELIIMGVRSIQQGESPALVKEKIEGYLEERDLRALDESRAP